MLGGKKIGPLFQTDKALVIRRNPALYPFARMRLELTTA